ncbi:MAG: glucosaminidase domain-containing protein [Spirochaetales bacterium]|nr:glucosaminidase domain-containing protein [Spirochaetales bacterium]
MLAGLGSVGQVQGVPPNPFLMASGALSPWERARFLVHENPSISLAVALNFSLLYQEEARSEGVNPDVAFAQMLLETHDLRFGGQVQAAQNNFAGIGAIDGGNHGLSFLSPREGVRAQIQHLKYYAGNAPLVHSPVNPRLIWIRRSCAPTIWQLAGTWASDPEYGVKLNDLLNRMTRFAQKDPLVTVSHVFGGSG